MQTITADIWDYIGQRKIVVPTNLQGPMGKGLALQACERFPMVEPAWKGRCKRGLAKPGTLVVGKDLILMPTKYRWRDKSDLGLIEKSLEALAKLDCPIALPRIGIGFGERGWKEVMPLIERWVGMKDNVILVIAPKEVRVKYPESFRPGSRQDQSI